VPPLPDDPTARLLWLVSDEACAGKPWVPSAAEQDAAWRRHFERSARTMHPAVAQ
jgi:hypothetical protein